MVEYDPFVPPCNQQENAAVNISQRRFVTLWGGQTDGSALL